MEFSNCDETIKFVLRKMINLQETNVWTCGPSAWGIFIYSFVIPTISALGIIGNVLILAVLGRKSLKASTYTYLAGANLITCILLVFSGLSKGIFWGDSGWLEFDTFVHLPIGSVSSSVAVLATVFVTLDRLVLVSGQLRCKPPKFCDSAIARKIMCYTFPIVLSCNVPYCFIYEYDENGVITTTKFFNSRWYDVHNWLQLLIFGLIPSVFLLIGNGMLLYSVGKALRKRRIFMEKNAVEGKLAREQAKLTATLAGIVFVFLLGEFPTHLASRLSAISLLYGGDATKIDPTFMERFRVCSTVLNAISSSASFLLYCLLSPQFLAHLKDLVNAVRDDVPRKNKLRNIIVQPSRFDRLESNEAIDFKELIHTNTHV